MGQVKKCGPGVIKGVEPDLVAPRVVGRVETIVRETVGADLSNKRKRAVEVGIPRDGTDSQEGRRGEGCARVEERLQAKMAKTQHGDRMWDTELIRTSNAEDDEEDVEAKRTRCSSR